jgi:hypothetical protein
MSSDVTVVLESSISAARRRCPIYMHMPVCVSRCVCGGGGVRLLFVVTVRVADGSEFQLKLLTRCVSVIGVGGFAHTSRKEGEYNLKSAAVKSACARVRVDTLEALQSLDASTSRATAVDPRRVGLWIEDCAPGLRVSVGFPLATGWWPLHCVSWPKCPSQNQVCAPDDAVALDHVPPLMSHMALDGIEGVRPAL